VSKRGNINHEVPKKIVWNATQIIQPDCASENVSGSCGIDVTYDVKFYIGAEIVTRTATLYVFKRSERAIRKAIRAAFDKRINEVYNVISQD